MPEKIYRTGIYARLSREDNEHGESNSISSQKAICMEYISRHPDLELVEIYDEDDGYSGTNMERPGFQRMLQDMRSGKIDCAISKDLSRFSRNYIEAGNYLERFFHPWASAILPSMTVMTVWHREALRMLSHCLSRIWSTTFIAGIYR